MHASAVDIAMRAISGHLVARCMQVIAEAGIADHLGDDPEGAEMLAARAGVDADAINRILRLLVAHGVFDASPEGYRHTDASRLLRSDHPRSLRAYARMLGADWQWRAVGALDHALATGETGMRHVFGTESFDYLSHHPDASAIFDAAMESRASLDMASVVEAGDFSRFPVIADIGGGNGSLLRAVLDVAPQSRGTLFDLPHVAGAVPPHDCIAAISGSFFDDRLPKADAYLLRRIMHDWQDGEARRILAAIRAAAEPGARVLIVEAPLPEGNEPHPAKGLDIVMLAVVGGRERTVDEYRALMRSAGFRWIGATVTPSGTALMEGEAF